MIDSDWQTRAAAGAAAELLLDLGDFVTGGKRPPRWLHWLAWIVALGGAAALWRWFHWLFDNYPAWAIWAAGLWGMWLVGTLGIWSAGIKGGPPSAVDDESVSRPRRNKR